MALLKKNEIHLWYQDLEAPFLQSLEGAYLSLLNSEERKKFASFEVSCKKKEYWASRILIRSVLSRYLPVTFGSLKFEENSFGRPEISLPNLNPPLNFNISHCNGLLVCAVALDCELGIDVEDTKEFEDVTGIAKRYFSPAEVSDLRKCDVGNKTKRFYEYWTLKEAYIKARGKGLTIPLRDFTFELTSWGTINFSTNPSLDDNPTGWQFSLHKPMENHQMALAVRQIGNSDFEIIEHWNLLSELFQDQNFGLTSRSLSQAGETSEIPARRANAIPGFPVIKS